MKIIIIILFGVILNVVAQIILKLGMNKYSISSWNYIEIIKLFLSPFVITGIAIYIISLIIWLYVLSKVDVSFAYPFLSLGFVLVALIGWMFLGESIGIFKIIGISLIVSGIIFVSISN